MLYKNLLTKVEKRKELELKIEKAKEVFEQSIAFEKALLNDLKEAEERDRIEALMDMKNNNIENKILDGYKIVRNIKITNQIKDTNLLVIDVQKNIDKILKLGIKQEQLDGLFVPEVAITDKKLMREIIDNLEKIDDILLAGCEKRATEFLTITKQ